MDDLQDGVGVALYPNGDRFEGVWRQGQRNGRGRYWFAKDDSCLKGIWINDIFKSGIYTSKAQELAKHAEDNFEDVDESEYVGQDLDDEEEEEELRESFKNSVTFLGHNSPDSGFDASSPLN